MTASDRASGLLARPSFAGTLVLCFAALTATLIVAAATGVRVNFTGSMPVGVYRQVAIESKLERGDLVLVCLPAPIAEFAHQRGYVPRGAHCSGELAPVGKFVMATAGDTVSVTRDGLFVNGVFVPQSRALERDRQGRPLPRLAPGQYHVGLRSLWILGSSDRSFDSRYFGKVCSTRVIARVRPVWTIAETAFAPDAGQLSVSVEQR